MEVRIDCPDCDNLSLKGRYDPQCYVNIEKNCYYCHRCKATGSLEDIENELVVHEEVEKKDLDESIIDQAIPLTSYPERFLNYELPKGLLYTHNDQLIIPCYDWSGVLRAIKYRTLSTKNYTAEPGSEIGYYFLLSKTDQPKNQVLITEGELDAITARLLGFPGDILALQTSSIKEDVAERCRAYYKKIYIALDNDKVGKKGTKEVLKEFKYKNTKTFIYPASCKDINEVLLNKGREEAEVWMRRQLSISDSVPPVTYSTLKKEVESYLFENNVNTFTIKSNIEMLDSMLGGGLRLGETTIVHAKAKTGKTTFLNQLTYNIAMEGNKIGIASFEMTPSTDIIPSLQSMYFKQNVRYNAALNRINKEELSKADSLLNYLYFYNQSVSEPSLENVLRFIEDCVHKGIKIITVDHTLFLVKSAKESDEHVEAYKQLSLAAKRYNIHIIIVAQAPKLQNGMKLGLETPYGGVAATMFAHNFITLQRQDNVNDVLEIRLLASRYPNSKPSIEPLLMFYDRETCSLTDQG